MDNNRVKEIKEESWKLFDKIAPRYDLANRFLSMGRDLHWRRFMISLIDKDSKSVLDLATGTGDVILSVADHCRKAQLTGVDPSDQMLVYASKKNKKNRVKFVCSDARCLPFEEGRFDVVTISFGIRNIVDYTKAFKEIFRVLDSGGNLFILEFSLPQNSWMKKACLFYLRKVVPLVGGCISGDFESYRYLNRSIEYFPYGQKLVDELEVVGFRPVKVYSKMFGAVSIYHVQKG